MAKDILIELGHLFLGSRLKRLAERFQGEAGRIMRAAGLPVQPVHFPLLAAIDRFGPLTVSEAVEALGISQPAVTRTAGQLVEMGILDTTRDGADLRQKTLRLTEQGRTMMAHARAVVWPRVDRAVAEMCAGTEGDMLAQILALEIKLDQQSLEDRVNAIAMPNTAMPTTATPMTEATRGLGIRDYSDDLAADFHRINAEWIDSMFVLEQNDIDILTRPRELIIDRGGAILFVEAEGLGVIGTCALIRIEDGVFELTKMGVSEAARGRKAGEYLLAAILERAREMGIEKLYLLTNSKCASAIHLYEKLGFEHDAGIMRDYGARYERCNVAMLYRPSAFLTSSSRTWFGVRAAGSSSIPVRPEPFDCPERQALRIKGGSEIEVERRASSNIVCSPHFDTLSANGVDVVKLIFRMARAPGARGMRRFRRPYHQNTRSS